jgi:hypothetical protein
MSTLNKMSTKTSQQVVSPVAGAVLGFYYQPFIGFLIALAFGFQQSPFKLNVKNKYFGCKINWQLFLVYFVLGLACQVLNAITLFLGLAIGVGLRWYLSDGDLEKYGDYLDVLKEYLKKYSVVFNNFATEKTEWVFNRLNQFQQRKNEDSRSKLDSFLSSAQPVSQDTTTTYQENPSISSTLLPESDDNCNKSPLVSTEASDMVPEVTPETSPTSSPTTPTETSFDDSNST